MCFQGSRASGSFKSISKIGWACGGESVWELEPDAVLGGGDPDNYTQVPGGGAQELQGIVEPVLHRFINSLCSLLLRVLWTSNLTGISSSFLQSKELLTPYCSPQSISLSFCSSCCKRAGGWRGGKPTKTTISILLPSQNQSDDSAAMKPGSRSPEVALQMGRDGAQPTCMAGWGCFVAVNLCKPSSAGEAP